MKKIPIVVREGWYNMPPINKEKYVARTGLEGPFQTRNGKVVYYDPVEGSYYDPDSDIYLSYEDLLVSAALSLLIFANVLVQNGYIIWALRC
jgi:hypothetical protein